MNLLEWFQMEYPDLVQRMKNCSHHYDNQTLNPFHLEGDVFSHTLMVHLLAIRNYPDNIVLHLATLLHDIGKPDVRTIKEDTERVRFFNHAPISFYRAIDILNKLQSQPGILKIGEKEEILTVIAMHNDFFEVFTHDNCNEETLKNLSKQFSVFGNSTYQNLIRMVECDTYGKFSTDDRINSQEFEWFKRNTLDGFEAEEKENQLTILVGPPCSGKTNFAENSYNREYLPGSLHAGWMCDERTIINRDDLVMEIGGLATYQESWDAVDQKLVDNALMEKWREATGNKEDVVIDMTNMSKKSRRKWLSQVPKTYNTKAVVFATGYDVMQERNRNREGKVLDFDDIIVRFMKSFVMPDGNEFDKVEIVL